MATPNGGLLARRVNERTTAELDRCTAQGFRGTAAVTLTYSSEQEGAVERMDASAFRHFYDYHFSENRKLWDNYVAVLSDEQFTRSVSYSHGSVRDQVVHLIQADAAWFGDLRGRAIPEPPSFGDGHDRDGIRAFWEVVEGTMRDYFQDLRDEMLRTKPLRGEDKDLLLWQVLLHVANHGTDHRAQILRVLSDLGVKTTSQDYVFYAYEHPAEA